eukprot:gene11638-34347_t
MLRVSSAAAVGSSDDSQSMPSPNRTVLPGFEAFTSAPNSREGALILLITFLTHKGNLADVPRRLIVPLFHRAKFELASCRYRAGSAEGVPSSSVHEELHVAMGGMSVQQIMDVDIDNLVCLIDKHHCQTKKAVLEHYMETKRSMISAHEHSVEEEHKQCQQKLATKQGEIELLVGDVAQSKQRSEELVAYLSRMSCAYDYSKHRFRTLSLLRQSFTSWRRHAMIGARSKRRMQRAEDWYSKEHLQRHVLRAWFRVAMQQHRLTLNTRYQQDVDEAAKGIDTQYRDQIMELKLQLQSAQERLTRETAAREKLEEDMKQAFMRGVCALNIEAMSIMKRGAPPGGANPIPAGVTTTQRTPTSHAQVLSIPTTGRADVSGHLDQQGPPAPRPHTSQAPTSQAHLAPRPNTSQSIAGSYSFPGGPVGGAQPGMTGVVYRSPGGPVHEVQPNTQSSAASFFQQSQRAADLLPKPHPSR